MSAGDLSEGSGIDLAPGLGKLSLVGQSVIKQDLELLRLDRMQSLVGCGGSRPPPEPALREPAQTKPKSLTIINEEFESRARGVAEDEQRAGHGVLAKLIPAKGGERINAFAEVDRLAGKQDLELWNELDH